MEDSETEERVEKWLTNLSKGRVGQEVENEAAKGVRVVKLHKGFLLCDFLIHTGVSDESGKWQEGAMATLMDVVGSLTASSFTSYDQVTVDLSISYYSKPNLQEEVEVEGKVTGEKGRMTSVRVEVRNKHNAQLVAVGSMWMAASNPVAKGPSSKL